MKEAIFMFSYLSEKWKIPVPFNLFSIPFNSASSDEFVFPLYV
jgi:hypothetical protein